MKVFLDTNIALDFIMERENFVDDARKVIAYCLNCQHTLYLSSISYANISYIARKGHKGKSPEELLRLLRKITRVSLSDENVVDKALATDNKDFEDAMQFHSASTVNADFIITRNVQDFPNGNIKVMTPKTFLNFVM